MTGAQFLAGNGVPVPVVQLLGRWSSKAVERYTQGAPLALAFRVASIALGGRQDDRPQLRAAVPEQAPAPKPDSVDEAPEMEPRPSEIPNAHSAIRVRAERGGPAQKAAGPPPPHRIHHPRTKKVHAPDDEEEDLDSAMWTAKCGWRYGGREYFRVTEDPKGSTRCRRCFGRTPASDKTQVLSSSPSSSCSADTDSSSAS